MQNLEQENEILISDLIYSGLASFYIYDPGSGKHLWHNGKFSELLGIDDHELAKNPVEFARKHYHPDDQNW